MTHAAEPQRAYLAPRHDRVSITDRSEPVLPGNDLALADRFFFIAHDDRAGRPRLHPRAVNLGLAAALLAELVVQERIQVEHGEVGVRWREPPQDPLAHKILSHLINQRQHREVRTWLAFLAESALGDVAQRLVLSGHLNEMSPGRLSRLLGSKAIYLPTSPEKAAYQAVEMQRLLSRHRKLREVDAFLAGLIAATGLTWHVLWDAQTSEPAHANLPHVINQMHPWLLELVTFTEAAVGEAVLAPR